ncbi:MAG: HAMP domain-containing protein [Deltaproteobacteria bacterium]|nr:HAMP domain-containing protein [Deltaproteobacteria bacterium]
MSLPSLRARLLVAMAGVALCAVAAATWAAVWQIEERAQAQARQDFTAQIKQLERSLALRSDAFRALSDLSYVLPVFRQVAASRDDADFGLGSAQDDSAHRALLHQNLVDADWSWAQQAGQSALVAVADGQGKLLYTTQDPKRFGDDLRGLPAVAAALAGEATAVAAVGGRAAAMVAEAPALRQAGLLAAGEGRGLLVLMVRATLLDGAPKALYLQAVRADDLLADVALAQTGAAMALLTDSGAHQGRVPEPLVRAAQTVPLGALQALEVDGRRWLVAVQPLADLDGRGQIARVVVARDLEAGLAILLQARNSLVLSGLAALFAAVLAALALARRMARPVQQLERAARRVADGDLSVTVIPEGRDEIARLAVAFGQMTRGLAERQRLERTFKRYLAPEIVDYLLAHPESQQPGGERKAVSVSFADLAGFTAFAEANPPERVVEVLNLCLGELAGALVQAGGTVDKFMGDNCMGFFGAPIPRPDHAVRACRAALAQVQALERLALRRDLPPLQVRIGINSGEAIVGSIGGAQAQDYTVVGDSVNLAARLEAVNKLYGTQILCTAATVAAAETAEPGALRFRELDTLRVVGKREPVVIYQVLGNRAQPSPLPSATEQLYAAGLQALRAGDFSNAGAYFEQAAATAPNDGASRSMAAWAAELAANPPPAWDGVRVLTGK